MDPNSDQFSIDDPFSDNTVVCPGFTLPRSFTRARHESVHRGVFTVFSIALSPSLSFTLAHHERQAYGVFSNLSNNHSRDPILDLFSIASIRGNSRALVLSIISRNQTRILFFLNFIWAFFGSFIAVYQTEAKLDVPYTVIRAHLLMGEHSALTSDYLKDLYSFCFMGKGAFCMRFTGEFTSRTPQLNTVLNEEKIRRTGNVD